MVKSFRFEYEKYIAGTAFLNRREKGAYVDLLCYEADKGRMTIQDIQNVLNGDFDCWEKLKTKFIEENGYFYNRKLEKCKRGKRTDEEIEKDREEIEKRITEKKQRFYQDCKPYLSRYPKEMLRRFYDYWTELNKSGTKLKFELQQTFEIGKRLATWAGKDKEFKEAQPKTYEEMLRLSQNNPDIWKHYKAVKREGERVAILLSDKLKSNGNNRKSKQDDPQISGKR